MDTSTNSYELQDYTSVTLNKNFLKFGARFRDNEESATFQRQLQRHFHLSLHYRPIKLPNRACKRV